MNESLTPTLAELVQLINDSERTIASAETAKATLAENLPAYWSAILVAHFDEGMTSTAIGALASPQRDENTVTADIARAMLAKVTKLSADEVQKRTSGMNNKGRPTGAQLRGALGAPKTRKWSNVPKKNEALQAVTALFAEAQEVKPTGVTAKAKANTKADMPKAGAKKADPVTVARRTMEEALAAYHAVCADYETFRTNVAREIAKYHPDSTPAQPAKAKATKAKAKANA